MTDFHEHEVVVGNLAQFSQAAAKAAEEAPGQEDGFSPIPAGKYHLECVQAEQRTSKAGKLYVNSQFVVHGDSYSNRRIFGLFMLEGSSKSTAISLGQLQLLAVANGREGLNDTSDIVGAHCLATVKIEKGSDKGDGSGESWPDKNRITYITNWTGETPPAPEATPGGEPKADDWF